MKFISISFMVEDFGLGSMRWLIFHGQFLQIFHRSGRTRERYYCWPFIKKLIKKSSIVGCDTDR